MKNCLHGIVGGVKKFGEGGVVSYERVYDSYVRNIYGSNVDVDVFIHSWSIELESELKQLYNPADCIFEKQLLFDDECINNRKEFGVTSRFYSLREVNKLRDEYATNNNISYDYVITARFDTLLNKKIIFEDLDRDRFYLPSPFKPHGDNCNCDFCNHESDRHFVNDLIFMGSPENMNKFSGLYNYLDQYGRETGHTVVSRHLHKAGMWDIVSGYFYQIPPKYPHIWTLLNIELYVDTDTPLVRRYDMPIYSKIIDYIIRCFRLDIVYFYLLVRPALFVRDPIKYLLKLKAFVVG